ncbi:Uncharacterised protein [Mycobacteroides abscessus subsp. abscessus]|nr:Uncharacterised protein [Mycobacteroides abscessus subsp. abscessus]
MPRTNSSIALGPKRTQPGAPIPATNITSLSSFRKRSMGTGAMTAEGSADSTSTSSTRQREASPERASR